MFFFKLLQRKFIVNFKVRIFFIVPLSLVSFFTWSDQVSEKDIEPTVDNDMAYAEQLANYSIIDGSRFALCRDFTAYLNRQTPFYYYLELKPDPLFKDFAIPHLKEVDKDYGIAVIKERIDTNFKEELAKISDEKKILELTQKHEKDWLNNGYFKNESTFYTAHIDANHSGKKNNLLVLRIITTLHRRNASFERVPIAYKSSLYSYTALNKDGSYKVTEKYSHFSLSGHPFYFRGRFYVASFSYVSDLESTSFRVSIHEPKVSFASKEGVYMGRSVCQLRIFQNHIANKNNKQIN